MEVTSLKERLAEYGQEHLLKFWDQLSEDQRKELTRDLMELDIKEATLCFERAMSSSNVDNSPVDDQVSPIRKEDIDSIATCGKEKLEEYRKLGLKEVADGRVAVVLLAGGQGTRLGVTYPKGSYDVGLISHKSLFQLYAERILRLQKIAEEEYGKKGEITWYILTSEATFGDTCSILTQKKHYGLKEENVKIFKQNMLPCFKFNGEIILDEKHSIAKAPDGNGGIYLALKVQGILDDMVQRNIRSVHAHSVDNILIKVADPTFLGYCLSSSAECGVKVVEKSSPSEPVGVVCRVDDHYQVVEYSEISKEKSELRNNNGELVYNAANICNHYFTVDFLRTINEEKELDLHIAKKKIPYIADNGEKVYPKIPNGIKVEKFIFDVFKFAKRFVVWQGKREEDFSPVKNADSAGQDCPSTARRDVLALHKKWLLDAGAKDVSAAVEISPLKSYEGENLSDIAEGQVFNSPMVIE